MEQEKRKKYTWIIIIILVILLLIFFVLRLSDKLSPEGDYKDFEVLEFTPPSAELNVDNIPTPEETNTEFNAINLARSFSERFGS